MGLFGVKGKTSDWRMGRGIKEKSEQGSQITELEWYLSKE
jgi:hypothetical protein